MGKHRELQSTTKPHVANSTILLTALAYSTMPALRGKFSEKATAVVQQDDAVIRPSKIPPLLRLPLLVLLSLTFSSMLYSFTSSQTADLASVSRSLDQWWQIGALVGWRM
jgi:hypothetical protein